MNNDLLYTICWDGMDTALLRILLCYACSMATCVLTGLSYVISSKEMQATFTGREQRLGVWVPPHLVARPFDRGRPKAALAAEKARDTRAAPAVDHTAVAADNDINAGEVEWDSPQAISDREAEAAARVLLRTLLGKGGDKGVGADEDGDDDGRADGGIPGASAPDAEDRAAARAKVKWDWFAYREAFPDVPLHAAITAVFGQYALIVGRITRHLGGTALAPMTLAEGASIAEEARVFITRYVTPILGPIHTTKVHKLLAHVLDAVRLHSTLRSGDTSTNEGKHKDDKRHYDRTNRGRDYTRQLERQAQEALTVLRNNAAAAMEEHHGDHSGNKGEDGSGNMEPSAGAPACSTTAAMQVALITVQQLSQLPGMGAVGCLLGLRASARVRSPALLHIEARLDGGGRLRQLIHASRLCHGAPWHDHIMYDSMHDVAEHRYGQVRAFMRGGDGQTFAVVARMRLVATAVCPLSARGCLQLWWKMAATEADGAADAVTRVVLELVPLCDIVRMVHVVPDMGDLFCRQGLGADPRSFGVGGPLEGEMLHLLNAFMPVRPE